MILFLPVSPMSYFQRISALGRIDVSGDRRRHPAETVAAKDQQVGLHALAAPDHPCEEENKRPDDGQASAVGPIVSELKHLLLLFLAKDTIYNF